MKQLLSILFFVTFFDSSYAQSQVVLKRQSEDFQFFYVDYYNVLRNQRDAQILKKKDLVLIPTEHPIIVTFNRSFKSYPVYLEPGDTCEISLSVGNSAEYVFKSTRKNGELGFLLALERKLGFLTPDLSSVDLSQKTDFGYFMNLYTEMHEKRLAFLSKYKDSTGMSEQYADKMKTILHYKYLTGRLRPFYYPIKGFNYKALPDSYAQEIELFKDEVNDDFSGLLNYRLFLINYNKYLSKQYLKSSDPYSFETLFHTAQENFSGKSRDFILFNLLKDNYAKAIPNFGQAVETFKKISTDSRFTHFIDSVWAKTAMTVPSYLTDVSVESSTGSVSTWQVMIDKLKGNVVYIDFWASWCGPCISEMPNSAALQQSIANDNVKFLYISIDKDKKAWLKALNKLPQKVKESSHYRLDGYSGLGKFFNLSVIPRYVIISPDGKIAAFDAGRPGLDDTKRTLINLTVR